jgi:hypothetical protein
MLRKFHRDVWLPERMMSQLPRKPFDVTYTPHAQKRSLLRPDTIDPADMDVIELQSKRNWAIDRVLYRHRETGVCYVVVVGTRQTAGVYTVVTVYRNHVGDNHNTLDVSVYVSAPGRESCGHRG